MDTCHVMWRESLEETWNYDLEMTKASMQIERMFKIKLKAQDIINNADLVEDDKYVKHIRLCNYFIKSSSSESMT